MSPFLAAYITSILAIGLSVMLIFLRSEQIVAFLKPQVADTGEINQQRIKVWGSVFAIIVNLMFALVAAVAYRYYTAWFADMADINFMVTAFSFTLLFSILAILTRKEGMVFEKISFNLIFGLIYGILIPLLA